jgi:orotate phosphoribosyltransferase
MEHELTVRERFLSKLLNMGVFIYDPEYLEEVNREKEGRKHTYYFETSRFCTAKHIRWMGKLLGDAVQHHFGDDLEVDYICGPSYRGIPLAIALASELTRRSPVKKDIGFIFPRKEPEQHDKSRSEDNKKRILVAPPIFDGCRVLIVDDVFITGETMQDCVNALESSLKMVNIVGVLTCIDRQEVDKNLKPPCVRHYSEVEGTEIPRKSILTVTEVIDYQFLKGKLTPDDPPTQENDCVYQSVWDS